VLPAAVARVPHTLPRVVAAADKLLLLLPLPLAIEVAHQL